MSEKPKPTTGKHDCIKSGCGAALSKLHRRKQPSRQKPQPKPTTDHLEIDAELAEGIAKRQAKPTTGEWTVKPQGSEAWAVFEGNQLIGNAWDKMEAESIAHCHNAALAADWGKSKEIGMAHDAVIELQFQQLREQLATAVEALKVIEIGHGVDARIARAALAKVKEGK